MRFRRLVLKLKSERTKGGEEEAAEKVHRNMCLNNYATLYDTLIYKNNFWRQLKELVDFSFVQDELNDNYSEEIWDGNLHCIDMYNYFVNKEI